jgi:hypothetical protein
VRKSRVTYALRPFNPLNIIPSTVTELTPSWPWDALDYQLRCGGLYSILKI